MTSLATVQQKGDTFTHGPQPHQHAGVPGAAANSRIKREVKKQAAADIFELALTIAENVMLKDQRDDGVCPGMPSLHNLTQMANAAREQLQPDEPQDLEFDYNDEFIPGFLVGDVRAGEKRHVMFAKEQQLYFLTRAMTWYLDGTFKVVRQPFYQLWSIHAFIVNGNETKQLPLAGGGGGGSDLLKDRFAEIHYIYIFRREWPWEINNSFAV